MFFLKMKQIKKFKKKEAKTNLMFNANEMFAHMMHKFIHLDKRE